MVLREQSLLEGSRSLGTLRVYKGFVKVGEEKRTGRRNRIVGVGGYSGVRLLWGPNGLCPSNQAGRATSRFPL